MEINIEKFTNAYFSNIIFAWRTDKSIKQSWLARGLGMSQPNFSRMENGEHGISIAMMIRIADLLDIEKEKLVDAFSYYIKLIK